MPLRDISLTLILFHLEKNIAFGSRMIEYNYSVRYRKVNFFFTNCKEMKRFFHKKSNKVDLLNTRIV